MNNKPNDPAILNDFFETEMRFMSLFDPSQEIGPIRYIGDMEEETNLIFVTKSPEVYE
jgi:hypothetical protein